MILLPVDDDSNLAVDWMAVVVSDDNGAPGSWRWSVKRRRGDRLETVATSALSTNVCGGRVHHLEGCG